MNRKDLWYDESRMRDFIIIFFIFCLLSGITCESFCQRRVSIAFYNVENLYDTIRSPFYDDTDFTPQGKYRWNTERYGRKLSNIARVIDDMGADVVGLAEVENEQVVKDLVMTLSDDYNYIHRTSGDRRGIDLALIYKGDKFYPSKVRLLPSGTSREFLHVKGELLDQEINVLVCHLPSRSSSGKYRTEAMKTLRITADSLMRNDPAAALIIMGDFNSDPSEKVFKRELGKNNNGFYDRIMMYGGVGNKNGMGSYAYGGKWYLFDNILLSFPLIYGGLRYMEGNVFVKEYMLSGGNDPQNRSRRGYPLRTITSGIWTGGYSDHLPVFVVLSE